VKPVKPVRPVKIREGVPPQVDRLNRRL